ncbi:response regulator transcription factor [Chitinimonas sp.]|uniref:response regulator transcription factor n=1 Tax=Chitinimonas sp. TaxID=1934313 RepID=UPI0035B36A71
MKTLLLVVEDQTDIRKLIRMTLSFGDYEVQEADHGLLGLKMAEAMHPALILLDVMMPGELDGLQVCQRIRADPALRDTLVVMLTARGQQADFDAGKAAGVDAYLTKPFSPLELIDTVENLLKTRPPLAMAA